MGSDMFNAILWNAIGRDNRLLEIILEKATDYEQTEIYYRFKNMTDRPCNFDLKKFCEGFDDLIPESESYNNTLKSIMTKYNKGRQNEI
jgi:hypothetical protein